MTPTNDAGATLDLTRLLSRVADDATRARFREAGPFRHVVLDDVLADSARTALFEGFVDERLTDVRDEFYACEATGKRFESAALSAFHAALQSDEALRAFSRLLGRALRRADARGFVYRAGHYLLPHSDHDDAATEGDAARAGSAGRVRALAYALYLDTPEPVSGGELELFACELEGREIVRTRASDRIAYAPGRLALFEVHEGSLHQVREVLSGVRVSISGWFYP